MCGFTGFFGGGDFQREEVIRRMNEQIAHRGPDGEGFFTDENIALGFRRLAIIDPEGGAQPMHSADGRYVIVFNGEIYNYRELRAKLIETHGCNFKTKSDTEVILQLYGIYGVKTASMLRGMFAFVIYDKEEHRMYGARDYFGIKPFYYAHMGGEKSALWFRNQILFAPSLFSKKGEQGCPENVSDLPVFPAAGNDVSGSI